MNHVQSCPREWATKFQQAKHNSLDLQVLWRGITLLSDPFHKWSVLGAKPHRPIYISLREYFTLRRPEVSIISLSLKSLRGFRKGFQRRWHTKWGLVGFPVVGTEKEGILMRENSSQSTECVALMVSPTALRKHREHDPSSQLPRLQWNEQLDELHQEEMFWNLQTQWPEILNSASMPNFNECCYVNTK